MNLKCFEYKSKLYYNIRDSEKILEKNQNINVMILEPQEKNQFIGL